MVFGDVVDQLHDDNGLAHTRAAEQSDFAALQERLDEIDDFHAGLKHLGGGRLFVERRSEAVDRHSLFVFDGAKLIDWIADHVHHAPQRSAAHGHGDRPALIDGFHAAHHAVGGLHGDAAHAAFAEVLLHLENHIDGIGHGEAVAHDLHGLIDRRQLPFGKLHVHRWPRRFE